MSLESRGNRNHTTPGKQTPRPYKNNFFARNFSKIFRDIENRISYAIGKHSKGDQFRVQPAVQVDDKFQAERSERKSKACDQQKSTTLLGPMLKFRRSAENWEEIFGEKAFNFKNNVHTSKAAFSARKLRRKLVISIILMKQFVGKAGEKWKQTIAERENVCLSALRLHVNAGLSFPRN